MRRSRSIFNLMLGGLAAAAVIGCGNEAVHEIPPTEAPTLVGHQIQVSHSSLAMLTVEPFADSREPRVVRAPARVVLRDDRATTVDTPVAARIVEIHATIGDTVSSGAPLATLVSPDAASIRVELSKARIAHEVALAEAQRQRLMLDKGIGTEIEMRLAEAQRREAAHELDRARRAASFLGRDDHERVTLRAPRDGIVVSRNASIGSTAEPGGEPLFIIGSPDDQWLIAEVFELEMSGLREGLPVQIEVFALAEAFEGTVYRIGTMFAESTGRVPVYITLDAPRPGIWPGMLARVEISVTDEDERMIPMTAVLIKDERRSIVYVQHDEIRFEAREVKLGRASQGYVRVIDGLEPGERIVVKGALLLDGAASQLM